MNIIMNREKRAAYNSIKQIGIGEDGIIFGGMVRDEIIATHYGSLFDAYCNSMPPVKKHYNKYWNINYHSETHKRTIIPNDMDIYFRDNEKSESFIRAISNLVELYNGKIRITDSILYEFGDNLVHKKIGITLFIGKTFIYPGTILRINIDIITNMNPTYSIEPPFNNGDFTSNLFVMSKIVDDKYQIRLSNNTGTLLDSMSYTKKLNVQLQIINDLVSGKTEFIRRSMSNSAEYINGMRILKMLEKNIKITNLLFREVEETSIEQDCDICQMDIKSIEYQGDSFIELLTNKHAINVMHKSCFKRYLRNEILKKNRNAETNKIECRCTRRNTFKFNDSHKYSCVF